MSFLHYLEGTVLHKADRSIILSVGSLGFELLMPLDEAIVVGNNLKVFTHIAWNADSGPTLFGFISLAQRDFFLLIIDSPGIGPKLGLTILGSLSLTTLITGIQKEDNALLSGISGIGAKKGSVLFLELKHKLPAFLKKYPQQQQSNTSSIDWNMLNQVLISLQYKRLEIDAALMHLQASADRFTSFDHALKNALQFLTQRR